MKRSLVGALGLVLSLMVMGCGGGDGGSSGAQSACNAYCDKYAAANCPDPNYPSADECKTGECQPLAQAPANCQGAVETYYDCLNAQADVCADGCITEFAAIFNCVGGQQS